VTQGGVELQREPWKASPQSRGHRDVCIERRKSKGVMQLNLFYGSSMHVHFSDSCLH